MAVKEKDVYPVIEGGKHESTNMRVQIASQSTNTCGIELKMVRNRCKPKISIRMVAGVSVNIYTTHTHTRGYTQTTQHTDTSCEQIYCTRRIYEYMYIDNRQHDDINIQKYIICTRRNSCILLHNTIIRTWNQYVKKIKKKFKMISSSLIQFIFHIFFLVS